MNVSANRSQWPQKQPDMSVIMLSDHGSINGGQAKVAIDSALHLKRAGVDVSFIAGVSPIDERLLDSGIDCRVVGDHDIASDPSRLRAATKGIWNRAAARAVTECIDTHDPAKTVVHMHGWAKALSPSIGPAVTRSRAAHVYTLHEYFLACPNGGFFDYRAGRICKRTPLGLDCLTTRCDARGDLDKAWRVGRQAALKHVSRLPREVREIIYLAPRQRLIMEPYVSAEARWHYLPNAVEAKAERRLIAEDNDLFLFAGRLSSEKGTEVAAKAAAIANVPIVICGDGECSDAVRQANPQATMPGWVGQEQLRQWMRRARCLVFPSLWYECDPLVIADALGMGLPILVSDASVAVSSIDHGVSGLHVASGDVAAWADTMASLQSNEVVQRLSEGAFRAGRQLLEYADYTTRLIDIYQAALARRKSVASGLRMANS